MALAECPECRGTVSDRAAMCPHCGFPFRPDWRSLAAVAWRRGFRYAGITVVALPAMFIATVVVGRIIAGAPISAVLTAPLSGWVVVWALVGAIAGGLAIGASALVRAVRRKGGGWEDYWEGSRRAATAVIWGYVLLACATFLFH